MQENKNKKKSLQIMRNFSIFKAIQDDCTQYFSNTLNSHGSCVHTGDLFKNLFKSKLIKFENFFFC